MEEESYQGISEVPQLPELPAAVRDAAALL
jgi:hypothetical protein